MDLKVTFKILYANFNTYFNSLSLFSAVYCKYFFYVQHHTTNCLKSINHIEYYLTSGFIQLRYIFVNRLYYKQHSEVFICLYKLFAFHKDFELLVNIGPQLF